MRALFPLTFLALCTLIAFASCKSNDIASSNANTVNIGQACNVDASSVSNGCGGGVCLAGYCRQPCSSDSACSGDAAVGGRCLTSRGVSGCALQGELNCTPGAGCPAEFLCGSDFACHTKCMTSDVCLNGQVCQAGACYPVGSSGGGQDGSMAPQDASESGSGSSSGGSSSSSGSSSGPPGDATTPTCSSPLAFGPLAVGEAKSPYQTGTGTRTANGLVLFSSFNGPGADGASLSQVEPALFDVAGNPRDAGASPAPLDLAMYLTEPRTATTAPDGTTLVLYYVNNGGFYGSGAALLNPDLTVRKLLGLGSTGGGATNGQDGGDIQWAGDRFIVAWPYVMSSGPFGVQVQMYATDGSTFAGTPIPTDAPSGAIDHNGAFGPIVSAALSGMTIAIGYVSSIDGSPYVQLLDINANLLGGPTSLAPVTATRAFAVAGTANGFVGVYDATGDAGEVAQAVSFSPGDAGASPTVGAPIRLAGGPFVGVRATSDGTGGGFAILRGGTLAFGYAKDNLSGGFREIPVTPANGADNISISSFGGRFGVFRYASQEHRMYGVATGCPAAADGGP